MADSYFKRALERLSNGGETSRFGRGAFWLSLGSAASQLLGAASGILAARILGSEGFGALNILRSSVDMITMFAGMGLGVTANRFVALYRAEFPAKAGEVIGMATGIAWAGALAASIGTLTFSNGLARLLNAPQLHAEIQMSAMLILLATATSAYSGVLAGLESFREQATISIIVAVVSAPLIVGGVLVAGVRGGVGGMIVASGLSLILSIRAAGRMAAQNSIVVVFSWSSEQRRILRAFTLPALISAGLVIPVFWIGNVVLAGTASGYHQLGLFAAANHWRQAIVVIPNILASVSLPILTRLFGAGDSQKFRSLLRNNLLLVGAVTMIPAIVLSVFSRPILNLYGGAFESAWPVMVLLLFTGVAFSLTSILGQVIASVGRMWIGLGLNACWASAFVFVAWFLCPAYGAIGLAGAYASSYGLHLMLSMVVAYRLLSLRDANH